MTNGEKFKTAKDRVREFGLFCGKRNCGTCTLRLSGSASECAYAWLDLEYEEPLKPCPFCGSEARNVTFTQQQSEYFCVECKKCFCRTIGVSSKDEAIAKWNRRVK